MVKKAGKKIEAEPLRLFYIFYNQERWDNWLKTLKESSFEADPKSDELPEGFRVLDSFSVDITVSVLKVIKLYQNKRYSFEEAVDKLSQVEMIVMSAAPEGDLGEIVRSCSSPNLRSLPPAGYTLPVDSTKILKHLSKRAGMRLRRIWSRHLKQQQISVPVSLTEHPAVANT